MSSFNTATSKPDSKIARDKEKEEEEEITEMTKNLGLSQSRDVPFIPWKDIKFSVTTPTSSGIVCFGMCACLTAN